MVIAYTSTIHNASELLTQDAIVRSTHFSDGNCILQLSCQRGFANILLSEEQFMEVLADLGISHATHLPGTKVLAYTDAARVVGIGAR